MYTVSHSENSKETPNKANGNELYRICFVQWHSGSNILFYFYSKSKIMTAQQYFREFLRKMYSKQLFRATVTSLERTLHAYRQITQLFQ